MFKLRIPKAEIKVCVTCLDANKNYYEALAYVSINSSYEVEGIRVSFIEAFDESGEPIEAEINRHIIDHIEAIAIAKALEKVESVDFESEEDHE